jgi:hypothetical protein
VRAERSRCESRENTTHGVAFGVNFETCPGVSQRDRSSEVGADPIPLDPVIRGSRIEDVVTVFGVAADQVALALRPTPSPDPPMTLP